jgi:lipopolysaccharide biosynthesis regulator YciM
MNTKEELELAYNQLSKAEDRIKYLTRDLNRCSKVEAVIVAAGLLDKDKFDEARSIVFDVQETPTSEVKG